MKVLVTGANGFVGHYLIAGLLAERMEVIATGRGENRLPFTGTNFQYLQMDYTDPFAVHDVFTLTKPDVVIHAGAMSKPDDCEREQWQAYVNNVEGTLTLLINAEEHRSFFIFLSTDFVFDGISGMYSEDDKPSPVNFYGKTKLEAEEAVMEYEHDWTIVRTISVYGKEVAGHSNLLTTVKSKLEKGEVYNVYDDQVRTPTYVEDLVAGIIIIIKQRARGVYHLSGIDVLTPYEMACRVALYLQMDTTLIKRVTAETFKQGARRPARTGFKIDKATRLLKFHPISFQQGLSKTFS